jgi:hypothetical protein
MQILLLTYFSIYADESRLANREPRASLVQPIEYIKHKDCFKKHIQPAMQTNSVANWCKKFG